MGELVPAEHFHVWLPLTPAKSIDPKNRFRRRAAETIGEAVSEQLAPDELLFMSLFGGGTGTDSVAQDRQWF